MNEILTLGLLFGFTVLFTVFFFRVKKKEAVVPVRIKKDD